MNSERKSILNYTRLAKLARLAFPRVVCAILVVTFGAAVLPLWPVSAGMPGGDCCQGKAAGHCESSILRKARQRKPEPMCGLKPASVDDSITIVAEPIDNPTTESRSLSHSIGRTCSMDCCASALNSAQKRRDQGSTRAQFHLTAPLHVGSNVVVGTSILVLPYSGSDIAPRGPPSSESSS